MSPPLQTGAYGVARRFFKAPNKPFPIMQIGPGIFATNESTEYEWKTFKTQIKAGLNVLLNSYPKFDFFSIVPTRLEIRYIDAFDKSLLGKCALFDFLQRGTTLKIELPKILNDRSTFKGDPSGRFLFQCPLKDRRDTMFSIDLGSGKNNTTKEDIVRMETKVYGNELDFPNVKSQSKFVGEIEAWLEFAHDVTSPFFKELILPNVMAKFQGK